MKKILFTFIALVITIATFSQSNVQSFKLFENGDIIVSTDLSLRGTLSKTDKPYDIFMIGVYQEIEKDVVSSSKKVFINPIKTGGIVSVKYCNEGGVIKKGDLITSSSKQGVGMKASGKGMVLGIALEDALSESGLVKIRILIQFVN